MRTVKGPGFFDWLAIKREEKAATKERTVKCSICRYTIAYRSSDTYDDNYDNTCIKCPECNNEIVLY